MSPAPPLTQFIGQTERALRALMDQVLADTGGTFPQWVALSLTAANGESIDRAELIASLTRALQIDDATADATIAEMADAGLLQITPGPAVAFTDAGRARHAGVRDAIGRITGPLFADIPGDDVDATRRVLTIVAERAATQLARA